MSSTGLVAGRSWVGGGMHVPPLTAAGSHRKKLLEYLYSLKQPDGSFLMHLGGEVDVRWVRAACGGGWFGGPGHFGEPVVEADARMGSWCHCGDSVLGAGYVFGSWCYGGELLII